MSKDKPILIRYASVDDYSKADEQFKAMGFSSSEYPQAAWMPRDREIVLFEAPTGDYLKHELGHAMLSHKPISLIKGRRNLAERMKYQIQEFEAIYWGKYKTGKIDAQQLLIERVCAEHDFGEDMARTLEKTAKENVKEKFKGLEDED